MIGMDTKFHILTTGRATAGKAVKEGPPRIARCPQRMRVVAAMQENITHTYFATS